MELLWLNKVFGLGVQGHAKGSRGSLGLVFFYQLKIATFFMLFIILSSCQTLNQKSKIHYSEGVGYEYNKTILHIYFEQGFKDTEMFVIVDSTIILHDFLTTNKSVGLALEVNIDLPKKGQILKILLNKKYYSVKFPVNKGYNILTVNRGLLKGQFLFQKKHHYYD